MKEYIIGGATFVVRQKDDCITLSYDGTRLEFYECMTDEKAEETYNTICDILWDVGSVVNPIVEELERKCR